LLQADIQDADLIVALTNNDQTNILGGGDGQAASAASQNLALVNELLCIQEVAKLARSGCPYQSARRDDFPGILQHVRKGRIRSVYAVQKRVGRGDRGGGAGDVAAGRPAAAARSICLPGVRIGAIYRDKAW
jgi:trk system potassium uptake protein TrkA